MRASLTCYHCSVVFDVLIRATGYYLAAAILLVIIILFSVYNHQIVEFLQPAANTVKKCATSI